MTVCVVAIASGSIIVGAADRMLTSGDIQFEPTQPKIFPISTSIVFLVAGDSAMQAEVYQKVAAEAHRQVEAAPLEWLRVDAMAELYVRYYNEVRYRLAESAILAPLGLDRKAFMTQQKDMEPSFIEKVATELLNYEPPEAAAICAGVDPSGSHIYLISEGESGGFQSQCLDSVGFAAIGIGTWHANSQLMFERHDRNTPFPETMLSVYAAKKRAEVAPGVGKATDMFFLGPALGSYIAVPTDIVETLENLYREEQKRVNRASERSKERVREYVHDLQRQQEAARQAQTPDGRANPPTDQEDVRDDT